MQDIEFCGAVLGFDDKVWNVKNVLINTPSNRANIVLFYAAIPKKKFFILGKEGRYSEIVIAYHVILLIIWASKNIIIRHEFSAGKGKFSHMLEAVLKMALESCKSYERVSSLTDSNITEVSSKLAQSKSLHRDQLIQVSLPLEVHECCYKRINKLRYFEACHLSLKKRLSPFFLKHQQLLQAEIQQLRLEHLVMKTLSGNLVVLHASYSSCDIFPKAEEPLSTNIAGMQMMRERRLRLCVRKSPSLEKCWTVIKILGQYFFKHQQK